MTKHRILGIDPGLNHTGFGVIDTDGSNLRFITAGCIHVPKGELYARLAYIYRELAKIIEETKPDLAAAEIIFLNVNPKTTLLLGQARGAAITCAATKGLSVKEFSATEIKNSVVGHGRAAKTQIQAMIGTLLNLQGDLRSDAADALACAVTCAHALQLKTIKDAGLANSQTGKRHLRSTASKRNAWEQLLKTRNAK